MGTQHLTFHLCIAKVTDKSRRNQELISTAKEMCSLMPHEANTLAFRKLPVVASHLDVSDLIVAIQATRSRDVRLSVHPDFPYDPLSLLQPLRSLQLLRRCEGVGVERALEAPVPAGRQV